MIEKHVGTATPTSLEMGVSDVIYPTEVCVPNVFTAELRKFHSDPRYQKVLILTVLSSLKMSVVEMLDVDECPPPRKGPRPVIAHRSGKSTLTGYSLKFSQR